MAEEWEVEEEGESLLGRSRFRRGNPEDVPFFQEEGSLIFFIEFLFLLEIISPL